MLSRVAGSESHRWWRRPASLWGVPAGASGCGPWGLTTSGRRTPFYSTGQFLGSIGLEALCNMAGQSHGGRGDPTVIGRTGRWGAAGPPEEGDRMGRRGARRAGLSPAPPRPQRPGLGAPLLGQQHCFLPLPCRPFRLLLSRHGPDHSVSATPVAWRSLPLLELPVPPAAGLQPLRSRPSPSLATRGLS